MDIARLEELEKVNQLALTQEEKDFVKGFFDKVSSEMASFAEIDTKDVEPMVYVMPLKNVLREDERKQPFSRESLLEGAPERSEDSWQVPRLVK